MTINTLFILIFNNKNIIKIIKKIRNKKKRYFQKIFRARSKKNSQTFL